MKSLIDFIYNGEVNIYEDHLSELLRVANILKIKGLDEVPPSEVSDVCDEVSDNRPNECDAMNADRNAIENIFTTDNVIDAAELPTTEPNLSSTSDQVKSIKKRKSVSFSDPPEFVCDRFTSKSSHSEGESSGNEKRQLRSLSDICSITKIKKEAPDDNCEQSNKSNELVVTINPHSLYSSTESINADNQSTGIPVKKPKISTSRKMIRTNENFLRALEAVRDEGIGFCKAAKIHGVNNRTLWLEYQKRGYPMKNARKKSQ